ncbi:MAG TPA: group III truncated hemoglobin [Sulfurovum sp.]|nr:group III truncated hemoglobin [Sulfurovum sp.]
MLFETIDRGNIEKLVRDFYEKVLEDELLSPFFIRALGDDLKNDKWYEHLHTLDNFWLSLLTGEGRYMGDPLMPHMFLGSLEERHFERWLQLFRETLDRLYIPTVAIKIYGRAKALSTRFISDLELDDEDW